MLPQPPPNAPAPPPSEAALRSKRMWKWIVVTGVSSILALLFLGFELPNMIASKPIGDRMKAVSSAKQVGLALFTFQDDYGSYPSKTTAIEVKNKNPDTTMALGSTSSNDFFRQLIAAGEIDQERPFFAHTLNSRKPDNVTTAGKCLEKGEVGFAYVVSHATCKDQDFPIVLTPLVKGKLLFDYQSARKFFDGRVVVQSTNASCVTYPVDKDGHVWINGKDFFDPSQPYWHGIAPKVAWPE